MWMLMLGMTAGWAQDEAPCVCPEEDTAAVFSRATQVFIARSGETIPSELTPILSLKGDLPERAYISETWEACDLEAGPRGSMMLVAVDDIGHMSRCGGAGPLPIPGEPSTMDPALLREWLRYGGWVTAPPPEEALLQVVSRELMANPLVRGEQGVAILGASDIDTRLPDGAPVRSVAARVSGPRWMELSAMSSPDGVFLISWRQEQRSPEGRSVWDSHSIWRLGEGDPIAIWRVESAPRPVLDAAPGERIGIEMLSDTPMIAAFEDGSAVALLSGAQLFGLSRNSSHRWLQPQPLSDGRVQEAVLGSSGDSALAAWVEDDRLRVRRYTPSGWDDAQRIAEPPVQDLRLAVSPQGDAIAVWRGLEDKLWARRMDPSGTWGPPFEAAGSAAQAHHVAIGSRGRVVLSWVEDGEVHARISSKGAAWGDARALSTSQDGNQPQGAIDRWGRTVVVWGEGPERRREIYARTYRPLRGWQLDPERLDSIHDGRLSLPGLVLSDGGGATVFWFQEGARAMLWARSYSSRSGWAPPEKTFLSALPDRDAPPQLVLHPSGTTTIAWQDADSGWTCRHAPGAGFGRWAAFEELPAPVHGVSLDGFHEDGVMFIWSQGEASPVEIWVREQDTP